MNIQDLYNFITSKMTPEEALMNLLKGHVITYEKLKFKKGKEIHPVMLISIAAYDMQWNLAIPKEKEKNENVIGMIVGTKEYVNSILDDVEYAKSMKDEDHHDKEEN